MSYQSLHGEWLSLMDVSGPFLAEPVLNQAFPQGLEQIDPLKRKTVRQAYDEWREAIDLDDPQLPALHTAWIDLILKQTLELDEDGEEDILKPQAKLTEKLSHLIPEHGVTLRPNYAVVNDQKDDAPLLLIQIYSPETVLNKPVKGDGWASSPVERMVELCRANNVRLGLVTNGEQWMLIDAPIGAVTTYASWYARLWGPEPATLRSFVNLLGIRRFFVDTNEQLPALFDESLKLQDEVTEALGEQVRRAVEVLIQRLDRADVDLNRTLLNEVKPPELYESALTIMMRIVFLLSAEERGLLLMGDERYEANYAVSTLRMQLRAESEEILERRWDAWSRLLSIFRAVYGGVQHKEMRLPALGGSLFDPDRFPFLEGRAKGSNWKIDPATPLPIDNRTVLLLLDAVQLFQGRTLSYRALDVEQIGYVYEGLLERTVIRAKEVTLDLDATKNAKKPWVMLDDLEAATDDGDESIKALLKERTGSSASRVKNDLAKITDEAASDKLLTACHGDQALRDRIKPYFHFLRIDRWGYPLVYPVNTFMVTTGADRRETGTHYTPKSLTEAIVKETLEPIVYSGPAEGKPREEWTLKTPAELLDLKICDPAMGSGAFLVQACRWLSERLVEAWDKSEAAGNAVTSEGIVVEKQNGYEPLRNDAEERLLTARRLIAEQCLYGVDVNPLAVELAKLSIWLITLAKGRPFGFLDHNLRSGDSLLGIHNLGQLHYLDMKPGKNSSKKLFASKIDQAIEEAAALRAELRSRPIRDIHDVEVMASLDEQARDKLALPELIADALVGEVLTSNGKNVDTTMLSIEAGSAMDGDESQITTLRKRADKGLSIDLPADKPVRKPFHWPLVFPEVFQRENSGFDAFIGNPPFVGNKFWRETFGESFKCQAQLIIGGNTGKIDLCVVFHRRVESLLKDGGAYGLLATSNIAEGSAISTGLGVLAKIGEIYFSEKGVPWPGKAAVYVSIICFFKGKYRSKKSANGIKCNLISARLEPVAHEMWDPKKLCNRLFSFEGVNNSKGKAFLLSPDNEWFEKIRNEPNSLLVPYITGNDITSNSLTRTNRWALDIADKELSEIERSYPLAHRFLLEVVKPTRTPSALKSYKGLINHWWRFPRHRSELMKRLRKNNNFVCYSKVTKYPICMLAPSSWIYTNKVVLIGIERGDEHAICISSPFQIWLERYCGGALGATLTLSISESIDKFPLPNFSNDNSGIQIAQAFNDDAVQWSKDNDGGMTGVMNAIHSPIDTSSEIEKLRCALKKIDEWVLKLYGWEDIKLDYGFHEVSHLPESDRVRYTISDTARKEVLQRLSVLNRERYEAEKNQTKSTKIKKEEVIPPDDLFAVGGTK